MLVLFDIDGTLLRSAGAGMRAMLAAAQELNPDVPLSLEGVPVSGRLDPLIWRELMVKHGLPISKERHQEFRARYHSKFSASLESSNPVQALPGVANLVDALWGVSGLTVGLLTGNYQHTGTLKLVAAGLDPDRFRVNAWADDGATRRDLPPVAAARYRAHTGSPVESRDVVIIGDTDQDIDCAKANGMRCLATATGLVSRQELLDHGADRAVDDLAATADIVNWITRRT